MAYHILPAMLLNDLQRQHKQIETQSAKITAQQGEIEKFRAPASPRGSESGGRSRSLIRPRNW